MSSSDPRHATGTTGEVGAASFYEARGGRVVEKNWKAKIGELDLVVLENEILVFVEVKTRTSPHYDGGLEAITRSKQRKIENLARLYTTKTKEQYQAIRFDVIVITQGKLRHIPNAWFAREA